MGIPAHRWKELIREAVVAGVQRNGERIFDLSQRTEEGYVPVRTGNLKRSGYTFRHASGIRIGYTAPYARFVHDGTRAYTYSGTQEVKIREHSRKLQNGSIVNVGEHIRRYVDKRLIGFKPTNSNQRIFRVMRGQKERPARPFLRNAVLKGIQDLPKDIEFYMRRLESGGVV